MVAYGYILKRDMLNDEIPKWHEGNLPEGEEGYLINREPWANCGRGRWVIYDLNSEDKVLVEQFLFTIDGDELELPTGELFEDARKEVLSRA